VERPGRIRRRPGCGAQTMTGPTELDEERPRFFSNVSAQISARRRFCHAGERSRNSTSTERSTRPKLNEKAPAGFQPKRSAFGRQRIRRDHWRRFTFEQAPQRETYAPGRPPQSGITQTPLPSENWPEELPSVSLPVRHGRPISLWRAVCTRASQEDLATFTHADQQG